MRGARGYLTCVLAAALIAALLTSCSVFPVDRTDDLESGAYGADAEGDAGSIFADDEDYDFSVFFGHAADSITVGRIVLRYKAETGISIRPIMTDTESADDRYLRRYLDASDPPAAFAMPTDAEGIASDAGIGWRFHGRGFAADRRMLADLIGAPAADAPEVDDFAEDIRLSGYAEWSAFLGSLDAYINGATYAAITLNNHPYTLADTKGRYSSQLNGVFAVSGADESFVGGMIMDASADASNHDALKRSRLYTTPQAFTEARPVMEAYTALLDLYTSSIAGMYAPGVRGDDFVNSDVYSDEYTGSVFAGHRAVFMPLDSALYGGSGSRDATQAEQIVLLPVKSPYDGYTYNGYTGASRANAALRMVTEYSLHVNEQAADPVRAQAQTFIDWLAADTESSDSMQLCMAGYHAKRAELPLLSEEEREEAGGIDAFAAEVYGSGVKSMLSDPEWEPVEVTWFNGVLFDRWLSAA
jgi:hypothetical protein